MNQVQIGMIILMEVDLFHGGIVAHMIHLNQEVILLRIIILIGLVMQQVRIEQLM